MGSQTQIKFAKSMRTSDMVDIMDSDGCQFTSCHIDLLNPLVSQNDICALIEKGEVVTVRLEIIDHA